jgi:hypothetical protein
MIKTSVRLMSFSVPSHHQTQAFVLAASATLGGSPELIDAEPMAFHLKGMRSFEHERWMNRMLAGANCRTLFYSFAATFCQRRSWRTIFAIASLKTQSFNC